MERTRGLVRPSTRQFTNRHCMLCYTLFLQRGCVFCELWNDEVIFVVYDKNK